jgi:PAS domain S-box-containing protein
MRHVALLQKAAVAANEAAAVEEAFQTCLKEVCDLTGWAAGHAVVYDLAPERGTTSVSLRHRSAAPASEPFQADSGLRAQVRATRKPAWVIDASPEADGASGFAERGWRGAVAIPVCLNHRVAGIVEFFSQEPLVEDAALLQVMEHVGTQLGRVVERAQSERHLSQYAQLLDLAHDTIIVRDLERRIVSWNRGAEQTYGWTRAEALGRDIHTLLQTQFPESLEALMSTLFQKGQWEGELLHTCKNGEILVMESRKVLQRDADGWPTGILEINRDVTARRRAEQALEERAQELARSNADLEQFANVASHDLQEPLRMVASYTQLLAKRYGGQLDERADRWIGYAVDGANRMQTLINDLLRYSRVGTRGGELTVVSTEAALAAALANLRLTIREAEAEIVQEPLPQVLGDETQLIQLFQNLIGNAVKFRGKEAPRVEISARRDGDEWTFSVRDNGIGVEQEFAERIFVIFQRLHERDRYAGTGIGLAISKRIVERHGGRIWLESAPGKGATFRFTLHAAPVG